MDLLWINIKEEGSEDMGYSAKKRWRSSRKVTGAPEDVYSQLSSCSLQVCVSMGYLDRSMLHVTVVVILK